MSGTFLLGHPVYKRDTIIIQLHLQHITHKLFHHITTLCTLMWYFLQTNTSYSNTPLLSQLPVMVGHTIMEPANFYDTVHGRYSTPWPPVYKKSWPKVYISCYDFCMCSTALCWQTWRVV